MCVLLPSGEVCGACWCVRGEMQKHLAINLIRLLCF